MHESERAIGKGLHLFTCCLLNALVCRSPGLGVRVGDCTWEPWGWMRGPWLREAHTRIILVGPWCSYTPVPPGPLLLSQSEEPGNWGSLLVFRAFCIVGKNTRPLKRFCLHWCDHGPGLSYESSGCPRQSLISSPTPGHAQWFQRMCLLFPQLTLSPFAIRVSLLRILSHAWGAPRVWRGCPQLLQGEGMPHSPNSVLSLAFRKILTLQQIIDSEM